ncbi:HD domain-containing protein [Streptomyces sp. CA-106131]|uniref:HD domain-containing protein n=1 Tax=Streptomyces sp. CA-106131 TaxID=3240045 RepID=UPI003D8CE546
MPSALDTPQGAAELAESLLPPLGNRWLHTQAVAARAREVAAAVSEDARDLLVAAAWLHDIGYALELRETGFHPLDGARHLERLGATRTTGGSPLWRRVRGGAAWTHR